jgi:hypothetical protein
MNGKLIIEKFSDFEPEGIRINKVEGEIVSYEDEDCPATLVPSYSLSKLNRSFETDYIVRGKIPDQKTNSWLRFEKYFESEEFAKKYVESFTKEHLVCSIHIIEQTKCSGRILIRNNINIKHLGTFLHYPSTMFCFIFTLLMFLIKYL